MSTINFNYRHLAASEIVSDILHVYGADVLLHIAVIKSDVKLTKEDFRKALVLLTDFQPALRMHIVTENKGKDGITKQFVEIKHLEYDVTIRNRLGHTSWLQIAEEELRSGFNAEEGPLWKVTFVDLSRSSQSETDQNGHALNGAIPNGNVNFNGSAPSSDYGYVTFQKKKTSNVHFKDEFEGVVLFKVHHVIADGISMFDVISRQLVTLLHKVITKEDMKAFETPLSILPGVDDSFMHGESSPRRNSLHRRGSSKRRSRRKSSASSTQTLFAPLLYDTIEFEPMSPSTTFLLPVTVGRPASREIIEKCVAHNVPVHSTLVTAASLAFGYLASSQGFQLPSDIVCGLPIDLREYRTLKGYQSLGKWLGYGTTTVKMKRSWTSPEQFWLEVNKVYEKTSSEKPWKNFEVYEEALKTFAKSDGDISFAADLSRPHFELFDLGNCDTLTAEMTGETFKP